MDGLFDSGFPNVAYIEELLFHSDHSPSQITPQLHDNNNNNNNNNDNNPIHNDYNNYNNNGCSSGDDSCNNSPPQSLPQLHNSSNCLTSTNTNANGNSNNNNNNNNKPANKRKRQAVVPDQSAGVSWDKYDIYPPSHIGFLYEDLTPLGGTFTLGVRHIDKNIQQSPEGNSWIVYRQNQFKLQCYLTGSLQHYTTPVVSVEAIPPSRSPSQLYVRSEANMHPVEGLYFYLYAIKQHEDEEVITEEAKIALHQVGPSRTKKETKAPDLLPITEGEAMFDKLQFQASTSVGGHAYFRVITRLVSKSAEGIRVISSQISPKMIVRAQNPGRYTTPKQINNIPNTAVHANFTTPSLSSQSSLTGQQSSFLSLPPSSSAPTLSSSTSDQQATSPTSMRLSGNSGSQKCMTITNPPPSMPMLSSYGLLPHIFSNQQNPVFLPSDNNTNTSHNRSSPWIMTREIVYHHGKVGINTNSPPEALSVQGNILVTGDILKPSDKRLKQNFMLVDTSSQLSAIENIKIYDYDVMTDNAPRRERGVIAQELEKIIPEAVHHIGDVTIGTHIIDNLLVVNERMLLLENIGATQHLDKAVKREQAELEFVNNKVKELEEEENKNSSSVMRAMHNMLGLIMSEDFRESSEDECLYCGVSLLGLGPAWTFRAKRTAGVTNILMVLLAVCLILVITKTGKGTFYVALLISVVVIGMILVTIITYFRKKRQRLRASVWKRLRVLMSEARDEQAKKSAQCSPTPPSEKTTIGVTILPIPSEV